MALSQLPAPVRGRTAPEHWVGLPRELLQRLSAFRSLAELKVVLYVLSHTYGYREYASMKAITLDEFEHGRKRADGTRIDEGTGLSRASIKLGLKQAKDDSFLYEVVDDHDRARIVRWYAVQLPSDGSTSARGRDSSPLTQPYSAQTLTNSSASGIASRPQRDSIQPPAGQHLAPGGIASSPRSEKETLERNLETEPVEKKDAPLDTNKLDATLQRQADQHILQHLMTEQEQLRQVKYNQAGWGEAQRRLRALAREIPRLQACVTPPSTEPGSAAPATVSSQAEPAQQHRSPCVSPSVQGVSDQAASAKVVTAPDPRRERLLRLQHELAQLKRTPSMQLLARQRIPKLEAEIKQVLIDLQESA
jgi:hypothetical protein